MKSGLTPSFLTRLHEPLVVKTRLSTTVFIQHFKFTANLLHQIAQMVTVGPIKMEAGKEPGNEAIIQYVTKAGELSGNGAAHPHFIKWAAKTTFLKSKS